jgi:cell division protein FtsL
MESIITTLTVLILIMSALIIYKQKTIINNLEERVDLTQNLYKELLELYNTVYAEWEKNNK